MSDIVSEIAEWVAIAKGDKCALCKGTGKIRGGHVTCPKCGGNKAVAKDANESLATILRHDEDHDNWHRMHGDEPCTSEADCAEKRAKYAEVKAEVAKSADEILTEIEQWRIQKGDVQGHPIHTDQFVKATEIAKGDTPGHVFHGNQWTAVSVAQSELQPASNLHLMHSPDNAAWKVSGLHEKAAELHNDQKNRLKNLLEGALDRGDERTIQNLRQAIGAHADAALEHLNASKVTSDKGIGQESTDAAFRAVRASRDANNATYEALEDAQATGLAPADVMSKS